MYTVLLCVDIAWVRCYHVNSYIEEIEVACIMSSLWDAAVADDYRSKGERRKYVNTAVTCLGTGRRGL